MTENKAHRFGPTTVHSNQGFESGLQQTEGFRHAAGGDTWLAASSCAGIRWEHERVSSLSHTCSDPHQRPDPTVSDSCKSTSRTTPQCPITYEGIRSCLLSLHGTVLRLSVASRNASHAVLDSLVFNCHMNTSKSSNVQHWPMWLNWAA